MLLAELNVRHTRRHMPTRRVALDTAYVPTSGAGFGLLLLGAVVAEHVGELDEEQLEALDRLVDAAHGGITVPCIALRYRLQIDCHGLDRSSHRIVDVGASGEVAPGASPQVLEIDRHGPAAPQVLGAVLAAAALPGSVRGRALRAIRAAVAQPGALPEGLAVRRLWHGVAGAQPWAPGTAPGAGARTGAADDWSGVPADRRWAMEVLGLRSSAEVDPAAVQRRFRRLLRLAHPDHGAVEAGAAERIAELTEARELLLAVIASAAAYPPG